MRQRSADIRLADLLDVIVVAVLIYAGLSWLRRSQSRFVVVGLGGAAALYVAARVLEMYLTLFIFQAVLTVAMVALVIIFQEDIRRAFEHVAMRTRLRTSRSTVSPVEHTVLTVSSAVSRLASARTGALIVFKGREPMERHLSGGTVLKGQLSEALLHSIFDPSSPGHDGAVVIDQGLVDRFGVQLPLSTSAGSKAWGTRHAAALGLSECSDALVLAVSEERGTISLAENGELHEVAAEELTRRLTEFSTAERHGAAPAAAPRGSFWLKVLSVVLAVSAWVIVARYESETVSRTFTVPIAYKNVPEDFLLDQARPEEVRVTLAGPAGAFESLSTETLAATLEMSGIEEGARTVAVEADGLNVPGDLDVQNIEPRSVRVFARRAERVSVRVEPQVSGRLPPGYTLTALSADPPAVEVLVARAERERPAALRTEPLDVRALTGTTTLSKRVLLPPGLHAPDARSLEVSVTATVAPAGSARGRDKSP